MYILSQLEVSSYGTMEVIQSGAGLSCTSVSAGNLVNAVSGDVIEFSFSIGHSWWSVENATDLRVRVMLVYCILCKVYILGFSIQEQSLELPKHFKNK